MPSERDFDGAESIKDFFKKIFLKICRYKNHCQKVYAFFSKLSKTQRYHSVSYKSELYTVLTKRIYTKPFLKWHVSNYFVKKNYQVHCVEVYALMKIFLKQ